MGCFHDDDRGQLKRIEHKLDLVLEALVGAGRGSHKNLAISLGPVATVAAKKGVFMAKLTLGADQYVPLNSVQMADSEGNPVGDPIDLASVSFAPADPNICTVKTGADVQDPANKVEFHAGPSKGTGALGVTSVAMSSGSASGSVDVEVVAGAPSQLNANFGQPQSE